MEEEVDVVMVTTMAEEVAKKEEVDVMMVIMMAERWPQPVVGSQPLR